MNTFIAKISYAKENAQYGFDIVKKEYIGSMRECYSFLSKERGNLSVTANDWKESLKEIKLT